MERVYPADPTSADQLGGAAVVVFTQGRHVGLLFREADQSVRVLHLCGHLDLRCDLPQAVVGEALLYVVPALDPVVVEAVSAFTRLVRSRHVAGGLPYGYSPPDQFFDARAGFLQPGGEGLTCASFILAVFHRSGVQLIEYQSWPARPEDAAQQQWFVNYFRRTGRMTDAEATALATTIGRTRYRPLEVAGAAAAGSHPANFAVCEGLGKELATML